MIASPDPRYISPEDYLAGEKQSSVRYEYRNGEVYAMSGGSDAHETIAPNLLVALKTKLQGSGCRVYISGMKVQIESKNCFYYPDVMVTCDERDRTPEGIKYFPKLIVEVLSPSTEKFDRTLKFSDYRAIETLEEYVVVSQDRQCVEVYRQGDREWSQQTYDAGEVSFESLGIGVAIADIYDDVL
ncbi:MAG: Uma2 family endonuclease [Cyanobacteria bacterium P01_H01_bin.130]